MSKASRKWLVEFESWSGWSASQSFIERMDVQLKSEFEKLTGKVFDGKRFHFMIGHENGLEYIDDIETPLGIIRGTLMFTGTSVETSFYWSDTTSKRLFKVDDDISTSNVEFHWIDFPINDWAVSQIKENVLIDIRESHFLDVSFPVFASFGIIGTDVSFNIKLSNNSLINEVMRVLESAQTEWNQVTMASDSNNENFTGIVHSVRFQEENEDGQAVFPIDFGSANERVFKYFIDKLGQSEIPILELEIENG